ncbi:NADH dehydrogenase (quinone) [Thiorhodococcus drewsii AZ1]|uniref:NADH dehydrogenase (Quinone) n=1 Tax=Thiorhodococcus drewsii AZ1 TaxID=765913 RepID=G2E568_9GAMM|nr:monovalent cation/H+ antiporter subunit D [Thiorhodococcus drewsii]EGV28992.1 NADH dehydrogenase (quinone) [Thiorhodococcus drewsii AZ1]
MSHLLILPLVLPLLAGTLLLLTRRWLSLDVRRAMNLTATLAQVALAILVLIQVDSGEILVYALGNWPAPYGIVLVGDRLAAWMLLVTSALSSFALLYAIQGTDRGSRHFHPLFQLQLFGLNGAFLTGDLFNLFVFFEVLLLASYGLLLHRGGAERTRAGLHFVALNLVGSTLFLFAAGTLYGTLGTLNLADMAVKVAETPTENLGLVRVGGLLLFGVFALKAAVAPLHLWLPATYAATSAPVAALFAIMTKVGVYCLLRIGTLVFGTDAGPVAGLYADWLLPLALATLILATLGTLAATGLRRQIGYLVLVSVGLLLTALALGSPDATAAGLYYLAHTTFATAAFFLLADLIANGRGSHADRLTPGPVIPAAGLIGGLFFVVALLVAGLPPLSGFVGKLLVLRATLETPIWPGLMAIILISSLLGIIALARSGSLLFLRAEGECSTEPSARPSASRIAPIMGLMGLCLALTIWADPILRFVTETAEQLLRPGYYIQAVLAPDAGRAPS